MEKEFDGFINDILEIEKQLNTLYKKSDDLVNDLLSKTESMQLMDKDIIMTKYENLMIGITHEIGAEMGFYRDHIIKLNKYINFRIKYNNFSDETLERIIDNELTLAEKKKLCDGNKVKEVLSMISEIKQNWNKIFENMPYKKFKEKIKLNEPPAPASGLKNIKGADG
jgi:hypothetical protein